MITLLRWVRLQLPSLSTERLKLVMYILIKQFLGLNPIYSAAWVKSRLQNLFNGGIVQTLSVPVWRTIFYIFQGGIILDNIHTFLIQTNLDQMDLGSMQGPRFAYTQIGLKTSPKVLADMISKLKLEHYWQKKENRRDNSKCFQDSNQNRKEL